MDDIIKSEDRIAGIEPQFAYALGGEWTSNDAGGPESMWGYWRNPQFTITLQEQTALSVVLTSNKTDQSQSAYLSIHI